MSDLAQFLLIVGAMMLVGILFYLDDLESPGAWWLLTWVIVTLAFVIAQPSKSDTAIYVTCDGKGRSQGWRLTPSEVAQALRSAAASGSYIAEPIRIRANETLSNV